MTDRIETSVDWLRAKLQGVDSDLSVTDAQLEWVDRACQLYAEPGLIEDGRARPLYDACPAASSCWAAGVPRPAPEDATVSVPWRGPGYSAGGIVAVGINFNQYGGLGGHWWIRNDDRKRLLGGRRPLFAFRAGTYLALVHASRAGLPVDDQPAPERVAAAWDASAFLEAVKCSPATGAGQPTTAMWRNCPPRYLVHELELLAPGSVVAVGRRVSDAIAELLAVDWDEVAQGFTRGTATLGGREVEVFGCDHPSHGHWRRTTPLLIESLRRRLARA